MLTHQWNMPKPNLAFRFRNRAVVFQFRGVAVTCSVLLAALALYYRTALGGQETMDTYQFARAAQQGKAIAPVNLNLKGRNPEIVYIGSYLVNAQLDCNTCHTCPAYRGQNPFKIGGRGLDKPGRPGPVNTINYLGGGVPFPGRGVGLHAGKSGSSNLTPDASGLPGGLTYDDFKSAMMDGASSGDSSHVLQVMPWPQYRNLHEADLYAIYQYLSSLPSAQPGVCKIEGDSDN